MSEVVEDLILPEQEVTVNEGNKEDSVSVSVSITTQGGSKETDTEYLQRIESKLDLILEKI